MTTPTKGKERVCPNCGTKSIGGDIEMFGCPMCNPTMEDRFWSKVDKHGISVRDRFIEPLLVHIKELMPDSDREVDIEDTMIEFVNKLLKANNKKLRNKIKSLPTHTLQPVGGISNIKYVALSDLKDSLCK